MTLMMPGTSRRLILWGFTRGLGGELRLRRASHEMYTFSTQTKKKFNFWQKLNFSSNQEKATESTEVSEHFSR